MKGPLFASSSREVSVNELSDIQKHEPALPTPPPPRERLPHVVFFRSPMDDSSHEKGGLTPL